MRNYKNKSFNTAVLIYGVLKLFVLYKYFVIVRGFSPVAIRFLLKGNTDSFTLRAQNDKQFSCQRFREVCSKLSFCHCGAGVRRTPLRSRSTDRAGRRDRR